jgi:lipopolysaccharide transport system permease protein
VALVDLAVSALLLVPFLIWYRTPLSVWAIAAPLAIVVCAIFSLGLGLWVAALNVEYRDVRVLIPFVLQIGLYVTPVVYPLTAIPERYRPLAYLNPMSGVVETFRVALFGGRVTPLMLLSPLLFALLFFVSGAFYFRRMERQFADIL